MSSDITLDKDVFKALAGETRVSVLKSLLERRKTQSELAKELSLAAPTIKDHVDILVKAGLVREHDDGHKWKYIELTVKGKSLLQPQDTRIMVLLGTSFLGIAASAYFAYAHFSNAISTFGIPYVPEPGTMKLAAESTMMAAGSVASDATLQASVAAPATVTTLWSVLPVPELAVLGICLAVFGLAVGMWIKQTY